MLLVSLLFFNDRTYEIHNMKLNDKINLDSFIYIYILHICLASSPLPGRVEVIYKYTYLSLNSLYHEVAFLLSFTEDLLANSISLHTPHWSNWGNNFELSLRLYISIYMCLQLLLRSFFAQVIFYLLAIFKGEFPFAGLLIVWLVVHWSIFIRS